MKIEVGDLVKSNDYIDPNVYLFGLVVGFHETVIDEIINAPHRPFKIEWFHKEAGWTLCDDFWYDDELELAE
jgi:hypothetical protein